MSTSAQIYDLLRRYHLMIDGRLEQLPFFVAAEQLTGVPKIYMALALYIVSTLSLFLGVGAKLVSNLIGLVYPSYMALLAAARSDTTKLKHWVMYFVAFGAVTTFDLGSVLWGNYIPYYYVFRTALLICLAWPNSHGAGILYAEVAPHLDSVLLDASMQKKD